LQIGYKRAIAFFILEKKLVPACQFVRELGLQIEYSKLLEIILWGALESISDKETFVSTTEVSVEEVT